MAWALLLLQSSLFFTRHHTNRWWTMFLETLFVFHGALIAWYVMNPGDHRFWSMFIFGGAGVFLVTHLHGLGLSTRGTLAIALPLIALMVAFYAFFPDTIMGLSRMAMILYTGAFIMAALIWVFLLLQRLAGARPEAART